MTRNANLSKLAPMAAALLVLAISIAFSLEQPESLPFEQTGSFKHIDVDNSTSLARALLQRQRNLRRPAQPPAAVSQDIGDVAVVVDNGVIVNPPHPAHSIDLAPGTKLTFTPAAGGFSVNSGTGSLDPVVGDPLALTDDSTVNLTLQFSFPFLGVNYSNLFVNSDGNLTFAAGDGATASRDAVRLIKGPPRIAPLLLDLNVESGGAISASSRADCVTITWTNVPEFGTANANTFQVTLEASGRIEFVYGSLGSTTPVDHSVVGVAKGNLDGPFNEIDLTADLPGAFAAGAIFEEFGPANLKKRIDTILLANEFYRTHQDKYDFLVIFTDFSVDLGGNVAEFNLTLKNQTRGIGWGLFDVGPSLIFGTQGELESLVVMNDINIYWPEANKLVDPPIQKFLFPKGASIFVPPGKEQLSIRTRLMGTLPGCGSYNFGLNSAMSIMAQEVGHRWMARVPFVHPTKGIGPDSLDLLGRGYAHWSFFFNVTVPASQFAGDPRASSMEGNTLIDFGENFGLCRNPGETIFLTQPNELVDGYTELDQYLMGLRTASEVSPFWYIDEPTEAISGQSFEDFRSQRAMDDIAVCSKRVNLTVANIQAYPGIGPRIPAQGDEDDDGQGNDVKTMAFILLVEQGTPNSPAHAAAIRQVDTFRRTWQQYVNGPATGGRGKFDTSLSPVIY